MNREKALTTIRSLTPDKVLFSPGGRLKIFLLQLFARLLPGRFSLWLSLLDNEQLERQVRIKFGFQSLIPGNNTYNIPRLHLIVERRDWESLQDDALQSIEASPDDSQATPEQPGSGLPLKPIIDLLGRIDRDMVDVRGRIRVSGNTGLAAHLVNALNPPATCPPSLATPNAYLGLSDHHFTA